MSGKARIGAEIIFPNISNASFASFVYTNGPVFYSVKSLILTALFLFIMNPICCTVFLHRNVFTGFAVN